VFLEFFVDDIDINEIAKKLVAHAELFSFTNINADIQAPCNLAA